MKKDNLIRSLMLAAGFLAVIGILCGQSFFAQKESIAKAKQTTEQSADQKSDTVIVPADAIPGHSVQVDDSSAFRVITSIFESEEDPELPHVPAKQVSYFFEVLFRTLIAPNAP